jgi:predicted DNA-binding ribbon-helix-helix protein
MKTTVVGVRLNDYTRGKLKKIADDNGVIEAEIIRILVDKLIEGKVQITNNVALEGVNINGLKKIADQKGMSLQRLIDLIVEQLNE